MNDLEVQLNQMKQALAVAEAEDRPGLQAIISQLEELISISEDVIATTVPQPQQPSQYSQHNFADDEFRKFQAEIASLEVSTAQSHIAPGDVSDESGESNKSNDVSQGAETDSDENLKSLLEQVSALEGTKCSAPFIAHWGQLGYYNAVVVGVESLKPDELKQQNQDLSMEAIMVRVAFTQPIVESMLPCPHFQNDRCRFADDQCKYSHGEVVSLSSLRDYKEPDFSLIVPGAKVSAKCKSHLWGQATVLNVVEDMGSKLCEVQYSVGKKKDHIPLHDVAPLEFSEDDSDGSSDSEIEDTILPPVNIEVFSGKQAFGDWEKYTLGFGSKLMAKMGYIHGSGLGKHGEGRIDPVEATIYPPGLSLDTCITLREKSGKGRVTVERKLNRQRKNVENNYKQRKNNHSDVFDFLNDKLKAAVPSSSKSSFNNFTISKTKNSSVQINKASRSTLNKNLLNVGENINQVKKRISKLKEGLQRQSGRDDNSLADQMKEKIKSAELELNEMQNRESSLLNEQKNRNEKKKLSVF